MAIVNKKKNNNSSSKTTSAKPSKFEERSDLKKLVLYIVIVPFGQGEAVVKLMKNNHSSAQFIRVGEGTASKQIRDILSIDETRKEIIYSLLREDYAEDFKKEIDAYFVASKKNAGVAFTIDVDSIVGVKLYKFLTQTVRG